MAEISKQALKVENNTNFPNNNTGYITPTLLREFNADMIDSNVNQLGYTADSSSWNNSITLLNGFTSSVDGQITSLSASVTTTITNLSASLTVTDQYLQQQINALDVSGSATSVAALNVFTASQLVINSGYNTFTSSVNTKFATLATTTGSLNTFTSSANVSITNLNTFTSSANVSITNLNSFTSSQNTKNTTLATTTGSLQQQLTNIGSQSGSWITESETSSFARTNASNTFTADQTITGNLSVSGIISASVIHTIFETSSVIFSSGSNTFGDSTADTQSLNGQTIVSGSLGVTGSFRNNALSYPTTDGTYSGQVLQTNAAGTLSFGNVGAMYQSVHNGEATSLTVGTAVYVSGSQGANPTVYRAVITDSTKMPAQYVITETITAGATGRALLLGILEGYNVGSLAAGTQLYVDGSGVLTSTRPTGSSDIIQPIAIVTKTGAGGQLSVLNPGPVLLPNLQTGYLWVGNGNNQPLAISTGSFLNENETGSFATTGSNTFNGNQTITGSLNVQTGNSINLGIINPGGGIFKGISLSQYGTTNNNAQIVTYASESAEMYFGVVAGDYSYDSELGIITNPQGIQFQDWDNNTNAYSTWLSLPYNTGIATPTFVRGLGVTGSLSVSNTLTASLQQGYVWVGNASGKTTTVSTSSFASTGSNTFVGTEIITGSLIVTGSARGNVSALSITSNTASMDLSKANYFTLTLADTTTTHITATNIQPGTSATLVITTGTNSSASLAPTLLQPSGNAYTASLGSSKKDVLSLVAVDSTNLYVVSTKNMI